MINLLYCGNDKIYDGMMLSLLSIIKHNKDELNVIILSADLTHLNEKYTLFSEEHRKNLENEIKKVNNSSVVKVIDIKSIYEKTLVSSKNENTSYTPYTLVRLLADQVKEMPDKVLYLDYDTMAYNDIAKLYNIDISEYELAGVKDYYGKIFIKPRYMNAGVLLLNMKKIKETGLFPKCIKMVQTKKMLLPDQSAINKLVQKKLILKSRFNEQHKLHDNTVIRHFSSIIKFFPIVKKYDIKPWHIDKLHNELKCFEFDDIIEKWQKITNKI